jgi:hypothetical protein
MAVVSSASWAPGEFGCSLAEVVYTYDVGGSVYGNVNEKPFISPSSAEQYANRFAPGTRLAVRTKPGKPEESVVREADQAKSM